ncbi:MAG: thiamine phosphate synthase [Oscillospiraceae bacterium]|nr:thiamine phosphate synthase [Oscillospiraceae bacterium]
MKLDLTLYLVTDSTGLPEADFLRIVREACEGGVTLLQLREKAKQERCRKGRALPDRSGELDGKTDREYYELASKVKQITDSFDIPLIIDDRADIALAVGAAGVHVGAADLPVAVARRIMGDGAIVGATVKTVEQAHIAAREGADYFGTGAIYPTTTKVITHLTEVSTLNEIALAYPHIPVAAIGGLNAANAHVLYDSEAQGIAVVSAIMKADSPKMAATALKAQVIANFKGGKAYVQ